MVVGLAGTTGCVPWHAWRSFLADLQFDSPQPRLWELTYVNRIPKTDLWESPGDWPQVFPGLWNGEFAIAVNPGLIVSSGRSTGGYTIPTKVPEYRSRNGPSALPIVLRLRM